MYIYIYIYFPRPSKGIKFQRPGLLLVVKGHKFTALKDSGTHLRAFGGISYDKHRFVNLTLPWKGMIINVFRRFVSSQQ